MKFILAAHGIKIKKYYVVNLFKAQVPKAQIQPCILAPAEGLVNIQFAF